MWQHNNLTGKRSFILGGTGLTGRPIARALAQAGSEIVVHGRDEAQLSIQCQELRSLTQVQECLYDIQNIEGMMGEIEKYQPIDILVVTVGPFLQASLSATQGEEWEAMCRWNLSLSGALVSACAPVMAERGWGRILLFGASTIRTLRGLLRTAAYSAAKAGIEVIARSAAREFGSSGVAVHVIYPGYVRGGDMGLQDPADLHVIQPEDIADAVLWLFQAPQGIVNNILLEFPK